MDRDRVQGAPAPSPEILLQALREAEEQLALIRHVDLAEAEARARSARAHYEAAVAASRGILAAAPGPDRTNGMHSPWSRLSPDR